MKVCRLELHFFSKGCMFLFGSCSRKVFPNKPLSLEPLRRSAHDHELWDINIAYDRIVLLFEIEAKKCCTQESNFSAKVNVLHISVSSEAISGELPWKAFTSNLRRQKLT